MGQQFLELSNFLLGELLARCKFFSEMNLQIVNIIGDTLTNLGDFFPFICSYMEKVWTNHKHFKFVNPFWRFQGSPNNLV